MSKNSTRRALRADALKVVSGGRALSRGTKAVPVETSQSSDPLVAELVARATQNRAFESEEQALDFFIDSVCNKLGDGTAEQGEMQEFLRLLVDTDPTFGEELLKGVGVRK
jgi:hypothetical protein